MQSDVELESGSSSDSDISLHDETLECVQCKLKFISKSQLDDHRKEVHQRRVTVTTLEGTKIVVSRSGDQKFHCPKPGCEYAAANSRNLWVHVPKCRARVTAQSLGARNREQTLASIVPQGTEITTNSTLARYRVVWNERGRFLICTWCDKGIPAHELAAHMHSDDNACTIARADVMEALKEYVALQIPLDQSSRRPPGYVFGVRGEPLQGLKLYDGSTCTLCDRSWKTQKMCNNHFAKHHSELAAEKEKYIRDDKCQTIFHHNRKFFFPVLPYMRRPATVVRDVDDNILPTPGVVQPSDAVKMLLAKLEQHSRDAPPPPDPDNNNKLTNWLYVSGIYIYMGDLLRGGATIEQLMVPADTVVEVATMVPYIAYWIENTMKTLHKTGQFLKRHCLAETNDVEDNKGITPLQEKSTVEKYAGTIARFMWFMIQEASSPVDVKTQFYTLHKTLLRKLSEAISKLLDSRSNQAENDLLPPRPDLEDPISQHVSSILCSIFQVYCSAADCQYWLPPCQFLARSMLKKDGSYDRPDNFTRLISQIQYAVRLAFAEEFLCKASQQSAFDPDSDPTTPSKDDFSSFVFLHKNKSAPFNIMRQLMHLATAIHMSEGFPDRTHWADHLQETLEINNKLVTVSGIRACIQLQDRLAEADFHEVVRGCKLPQFDLKVYRDIPSNTNPGENYLNCSHRTHDKYNLHLLKEWAAKKDVHGLMQDSWASGFDDTTTALDTGLWNISALRGWLKQVDGLMERLYFLFHVASGQPLRGTEESGTLLVNTRYSPRGLFMRGMVFAVLTKYHKGRNISGKNKPRMTFLTPAHSKLWHFWVGFIRPVAVFFLQVLGEEERATEMSTYLWVSSDKGVLDTGDFSNILERKFHEGGVAPLKVREWRQASVAICDAHLKIPKAVLDKDKDSPLDAQRGHTSVTANMHYGGTDGHDIDRLSELEFRLASQATHEFWKIDSVYEVDMETPVRETKLGGADLSVLALKRYTGDDQATFRSTFQARWLKGVFDRRDDYLIVARTGGGKSLAYTLPPLVEFEGTTIIIQPLRALVAETAAELERIGADYGVYEEGVEIDKATKVVVSTTDAASAPSFRTQLRLLSKINRFIVDEAHCYRDDNKFRAYASGVAKLRIFDAPFIFMTATLQKEHEPDLLDLFNIRNYIPEREVTARPELHFSIQPVISRLTDIWGSIHDKVTGSNLHDRDRSIVFIENISKCQEAEAYLKEKGVPVSIYHSRMDPKEATLGVEFWRITPKSVMVATSGFGAGINYKHVRHVFLVGMPRDDEVNKSFQEAGRAGRDGAPATVWLYPTSKPKAGSLSYKLMNRQNCIPGVYARLLDGKDLKCVDFNSIDPCTHCAEPRRTSATSTPQSSTHREPLPGTMVNYSVNVRRAEAQLGLVQTLALTMAKNKAQWDGLCGWCFAHDNKKVDHYFQGPCPHFDNRCRQCTEPGHKQSNCPRSKLSTVIRSNGTHDLWMCPACGLGKAYEGRIFHPTDFDKETGTCGSVFQEICAMYTWYQWRNNRTAIEALVPELKIKAGKVPTRLATTEDFIQWQGNNGYLQCPWANVVTLFFLMIEPDLKRFL